MFWAKKQEQEFRIDKSELPKIILTNLSDYLKESKRVRYYKELDGNKSSYEVKFKRNRLLYSVEFDQEGKLEDVEFVINPVDIPETTLKAIHKYLSSNYKKYRIKKIQQQHPNIDGDSNDVLKSAFQNLQTSSIRYELIISASKSKAYNEYEVTFNNEGVHVSTREQVKSNYDHVLFQ